MPRKKYMTEDLCAERSKRILGKINTLDKKMDEIKNNDLKHLQYGQDDIKQLLRGNPKDSEDRGLIGIVDKLSIRQKALVGGFLFIFGIVIREVIIKLIGG